MTGARSAYHALVAATVPIEGDPQVPLVSAGPAGGTEQANDVLPAELSLLSADQRNELRARRGLPPVSERPELLAPEMSLLTPQQRAEATARRGTR